MSGKENTIHEKVLKSVIASLTREEVNALAFGLSLFTQAVMNNLGTTCIPVVGLYTDEDGRRVTDVSRTVQERVREALLRRN